MAHPQEERIKDILTYYGGDRLGKPKPLSEWRTFADVPRHFAVLIKTHPGSGKSRDATEFVNDAWEAGYKGLYLMLSHDALQERLDKLRKDHKDKRWAYWRGHNKDCEQRSLGALVTWVQVNAPANPVDVRQKGRHWPHWTTYYQGCRVKTPH